MLIQGAAVVEVLPQGRLLFRFEFALEEPLFQSGEQARLIGAFFEGQNLRYIDRSRRAMHAIEAVLYKPQHLVLGIQLKLVFAVDQHLRLIITGEEIVRGNPPNTARSEEHTSELQSRG